MPGSYEVPAPVALVAGLMATYDRPWALCGGWAVDAWLGGTTREHADVDLTVLHEDHRAVFEHLRDWHIAAHDPGTPVGGNGWDGRELASPAHLHCRPPGRRNERLLGAWVNPPYTAVPDGRNLEVIFNLGERDALVLSHEPHISVPWDVSVAESRWGVPTIVPELLLFWKATAYFDPETRASSNTKDAIDFAALAPLLDPSRRAWMHDTIATLHPGHAWLDQVRGEPHKSRMSGPLPS